MTQLAASADILTEPLPDELSARELLSRGQRLTLTAIAAGIVLSALLRATTGIGLSALSWAQLLVAAAIAGYVVIIGFKLALIRAAQGAHVLRCTGVLADEELPPYTVLVPVYREGRILPDLLQRLSALDYPAERLQVLLLVEQDDEDTRAVLDDLTLPEGFAAVVIPPSRPRTKPKACNLGLAQATGDLCVIYDAEDRPDPHQLRKAALAFRDSPRRTVCVQAELQYWNPWTNLLTRFFAAEYALNFSLVLRGLDRFRMVIPLGGTSNHFRTDALRELGGWDPHNVTEDADLGVRIARRGWAVRMMDSVTEEEANSRAGNWMRQRSRWTKGYYQTWLVHMRDPWKLWRELGTRRFLGFQLTFGATLYTLLNPFFWALSLVYLVTGPGLIAPLFPAPVLYAGITTLAAGNLLLVYSLMAGCMERGLYPAVKTMLAVPLYWAMMSVAAYKALFQLLRPSRRHYWELTEHGLVTDTSWAPS
jgi:cellulose synthase/poly-beta-1,6-N-acetylglucosamine synthase-like glycosyltransferase